MRFALRSRTPLSPGWSAGSCRCERAIRRRRGRTIVFRSPGATPSAAFGWGGRASGAIAALALHLVRLDRRRHPLCRLPRRRDGRNPRAAGGNEGGLRGPSGRSARAARRGREPATARAEFLQGQGERSHVPAGPARTARRDRRRARRRDGGAQPVAARRQAATSSRSRRARRDPGSRSADGAPARALDDAARAYAPLPEPWRRASGRQASSDRRIRARP